MKTSDNRTDYIVDLAQSRKKDSILTIGVAHIPEIEMILENKANCTCIDYDKKKIDNAKTYVKKTKFIIGDITKENKNMNGKFDTVIMLEVLEHIKDDLAALKNIHKMLKTRGKLIISVPNKHPLHIINPVKYTQHERHYNMAEITSILKKTGFSIKFTNTVESPKLIFDLYIHLFCKYVLRKTVPFAILTGKKDKTYRGYNNQSKGMDCLVLATKD